MKLINVEIKKYKSFETAQSFSIDPKVTILVGKNESGKTAALESIAKTNYFSDDESFKYDETHDYPRKDRTQYKKSGEVENAVTVTYELDNREVSAIEEVLGKGVLSERNLSITKKYDNRRTISMPKAETNICLRHFCGQHNIKLEELELGDNPDQATIEEKLNKLKNTPAEAVSDDNSLSSKIKALTDIQSLFTTLEWKNWLDAHIWKNYLEKWQPRFMYFDEYYELPSQIDINYLSNGSPRDKSEKTAKALLELAGVDINALLSGGDYEDFRSELESTSSSITQHIFKYWKNNTGLRIEFDVEHQSKFLNIRVRSEKYHITLPLSNRSKGFNWFFSFIVWFNSIQEDNYSNYILLLDEPGLNLHAAAQADLLQFIEDLCIDYQIIYTTHSPFMVPSKKLERVRTVYEGENGSEIREVIQQKDADTLFPLQAALGYDIAQNLFINEKNLLVEGASDLVYLTMMSSILEADGKEGLKNDITITPVGGLDKVTTFISLLRGQELDLVCLLDSFTDQKGKKRLEDLIAHKIIKKRKILFFDEFSPWENGIADLEDLFDKTEYLKFFNAAFTEHKDIDAVPNENQPIIPQINNILNKKHFNHYRPANFASAQGLQVKDFSSETLQRFENVFKRVNNQFGKQSTRD